jgi:hypothetical protein
MTMMTYGYTGTETFTRADVAKVFENFEAGLCLVARTTGLWSIDYARDTASDVVAFAKEQYLSEGHIILMNAARQTVRVHEYKVATDASGWMVHRPDGNIWPPIPGGSLTVLVRHSPAWHALGLDGQAAFNKGLNVPWGPSSIDTTYSGLVATDPRNYASNAFGLARTTRERM